MTENDMLLVAGAIGLALIITLVDLALSMLRHSRSARVRTYSDRLGGPANDEAAVQARREWIRQRLSAIQTASNDPVTSPPAPPAGR